MTPNLEKIAYEELKKALENVRTLRALSGTSQAHKLETNNAIFHIHNALLALQFHNAFER